VKAERVSGGGGQSRKKRVRDLPAGRRQLYLFCALQGYRAPSESAPARTVETNGNQGWPCTGDATS